ncbi:MAG: ORF6N domain-containing protein [Verrucomicrobiota bacterium]
MEQPKSPAFRVEGMIHVIRGQRVMLSTDLARLYGVEPKVLVQAVKRNITRFPDDFMFLVDAQDVAILRSQFVTLKGHGKHAKYPPYAFTEQGVAMLSSVLRSERAVQVNITIMRAFVQLRQTLAAHKELAEKLAELERRVTGSEGGIKTLFEAIRHLMATPEPPKKQIGFHVRERRAPYGRRKP